MNLEIKLLENGNICKLKNTVVLQELNPTVCLTEALITNFSTAVLVAGRKEAHAFASIHSVLYL